MGNDSLLRLILSGDSRDLEKAITRSSKTIHKFGNKAKDVFRRAGQSIDTFTSKLGPMGTMLSVAGIIMAGKSVVDFDAKLVRLAIQGKLTREGMLKLKEDLLSMSKETNQKPEALLEGIDAIVERTGNLKFAVAVIKELAIVSSATGTEMGNIGATASNLQEKFDIKPDQILETFDILSAQGKQGSFTLQNMASLFERLLSAAGSFGITGERGIRTFGAFLQIARRGAGSSEQAANAVERTIADLVEKNKVIKKITGFSIFDPELSKKEGRAVMKEFDVVLKEIVKRTKGDITKLQKIFGGESIRAINPLAASYKKFGDFREFDEFVDLGGDGTMIMKDFAFWMDSSAAGLKGLNIEGTKFLNRVVTGNEGWIRGLKNIKRVPTPKGTPSIDNISDIPGAIFKGWGNLIEGFGDIKRLSSEADSTTEHPIDIDIYIDGNDRTITRTNDMDTTVDARLNRGALLPAR